MKYLTRFSSDGFNVNSTPSFSWEVNGMSTKTAAVRHALNCELVSIEDLGGDDVLLVEPMFLADNPKLAGNLSFGTKLDIVGAYAGRKVLLCSEMQVFKWPGEWLGAVIETMDVVLASCEYQARLMESVGMKVDGIVYEPVNEHLFYEGFEKKEWVVAVGSPTDVKNIEAIIHIFECLKDTPLETVYVGSPMIWSSIRFMRWESHWVRTFDYYERLKEVADIYYKASSPAFVAWVLSQAKYYLNFAYHETCCRTAMEAMLSGVGILAGKHPVFREYPCLASGLAPEECVGMLREVPEVPSGEIRRWALENVSYAAFADRVRGILG